MNLWLKSVILFLALSFGFPALSLAQSNELKVGVLSGLTGAAAKWGKFQNMGITLAEEEYRAAGMNLRVVQEDSGTQAPKAISAFNKLILADKVDAILGDDFGFVMAPLLPLAERQKKLFVALSLPQQNYCDQAPNYFFSASSQFIYSRDAYEQFFILHPEVKRLGIIVFDDPDWGRAYLAIWRELAAKHGVEIIDTFINSEWLPDYKTAVARMLQKKPDAIFQAHEPETFFKALSQFNYKGKVVIANHVLEMLAGDKEKREELEGIFVVDPIISNEFRDRFQTRFGRPPILEAYAGYEALRAIVKAKERSPQDPRLGMRGVKFEGVAGTIDFTGKGCAGNYANWGLFQFRNGRPEIVWKAE